MDRFEESERFMSSLSSNRSLLDHFSALRDPREGWRVLYPLPEILLLVLCATLSGMEDFVEIRLWGEQRIDFLRRLLPFDRGLPAHDTLNDVVNALDAELFKTLFANWVGSLREAAPDLIAIDGKTSRRTHARAKGREPLHLVSAWAARQRLVLTWGRSCQGLYLLRHGGCPVFRIAGVSPVSGRSDCSLVQPHIRSPFGTAAP